MNWDEWKNTFWHDNKVMYDNIDISIFLFLMSLVFFLYAVYTLQAVAIIFFFVAVIAIYSVFTDEVAHLYPFTSKGLSGKEWVHMFWHGRTHDAYGAIISLAFFGIGLYSIVPSGDEGTGLAVFILYIFYSVYTVSLIEDFYDNRFYH